MNTFNIEFPSICLRAMLDGYSACGMEYQGNTSIYLLLSCIIVNIIHLIITFCLFSTSSHTTSTSMVWFYYYSRCPLFGQFFLGTLWSYCCPSSFVEQVNIFDSRLYWYLTGSYKYLTGVFLTDHTITLPCLFDSLFYLNRARFDIWLVVHTNTTLYDSIVILSYCHLSLFLVVFFSK